MADAGSTELEKKIAEIRQRFSAEYAQDSCDKYDIRDVDRLLNDDALVDSYLDWRHYVLEDTLKMIDESLKWRKEFKLNDINESCIQNTLFESGVHYLHGYDKEGNKLFWFRVKLHVKDPRMLQERKRYVAFWLERYAKREPGMSLTVVFDMSESGLGNVDMEFVKYIINCFQVYYPRLLSKMLMYAMPWIMNAAWKVIKTWLDPDAIDKLKFVSKSDIQTYVDIEHLPSYMGGTDPFKYSYPPLPDDDFQPSISDPGHEDDMEVKDGEQDGEMAEPAVIPKKVSFSEDGDMDAVSRVRTARRPTTTWRGSLLHVSPAEELCFGSQESEKKCLIVLNNVTKNPVAFKVRTTAPNKYRVKPSNSSCEPGTNAEITVSLHGASVPSPQDRFLIMAAEMEQNSGTVPDQASFWKGIQRNKMMEHRLQCHILEGLQPALNPVRNSQKEQPKIQETNGQPDMHTTLMHMLASSTRLEQKLERCLWSQKVLTAMVTALTAMLTALTGLGFSAFYMLYTGDNAQ
ncbi:motile sperm domain-containing protein 2-like [Osmerus mordax]|uniref:motile sperm domain-containing protein 2-like n=1 Tax=Osmerus mordax TaxID=8014 RepID=UPI00350E94A9